jgi:hypothetical protein
VRYFCSLRLKVAPLRAKVEKSGAATACHMDWWPGVHGGAATGCHVDWWPRVHGGDATGCHMDRWPGVHGGAATACHMPFSPRSSWFAAIKNTFNRPLACFATFHNTYCFTVTGAPLLSHWVTVPHSQFPHCLSAPLPHCLIVDDLPVSLHIFLPLPHCPTALMPRCLLLPFVPLLQCPFVQWWWLERGS